MKIDGTMQAFLDTADQNGAEKIIIAVFDSNGTIKMTRRGLSPAEIVWFCESLKSQEIEAASNRTFSASLRPKT